MGLLRGLFHLIIVLLAQSTIIFSFTHNRNLPKTNFRMNTDNVMTGTFGDGEHPFCKLPGDPSLLLTTNVDLGDKKLAIMKSTSLGEFVVPRNGVWGLYIDASDLVPTRTFPTPF